MPKIAPPLSTTAGPDAHRACACPDEYLPGSAMTPSRCIRALGREPARGLSSPGPGGQSVYGSQGCSDAVASSSVE